MTVERKGQGPIFVLAGLLGRSEDWAEFTDKWQAVLDHDPSLSAFKMREGGWSFGALRRMEPCSKGRTGLSIGGGYQSNSANGDLLRS
jgi:hypothetical protein